MRDTFVANGASLAKIDALASWVRSMLIQENGEQFDVIQFIEIDIPKLKEGFYVEILDDSSMGIKRAFLKEDASGMIVSESIYEGASNGCRFSMEVILHEIGHLFMHSKYCSNGLNSADDFYSPQIKGMRNYESAEWQANKFALSLLYPQCLATKYQSPQEMARNLRISEKQAARALHHIHKVRVRRNQTTNSTVASWVSAITSNLNSIFRSSKSISGESEQLRLFG